jgi:phosphatidylserine decarboxylase
MRIPIASQGWPFIVAGCVLTVVLALLPWQATPAGRTATTLALILTLFVTWFFRDPEREIPASEQAIVSPADGKVIVVAAQPDGGTKVSIFLSIFNVHVNRSPAAGTVQDVVYHPGKYLAAWNDKASTDNERSEVVLVHPRGTLRFTQIAGLIARRIVCWIAPGDRVARGERYGLIRFGSRVDIFLPPTAAVAVKVGDRVRGGADLIALWRD